MRISLLLERFLCSKAFRVALVSTLVSVLLSCSGTVPGEGVALPSQLISNPASIDFGVVAVGSSSTESITLTNSATESVTISQVNLTNSSFSISDLTLPFDLGEGQSTSFLVTFIPIANEAVSGDIFVVSNASGSPTVILLAGSGLGGESLVSLNPNSVNFGDVLVGGSSTRAVNLLNLGSNTETIFQADVNGSRFSISGVSIPLVLSGGATVGFSVTFSPIAGGNLTGSVSFLRVGSSEPTTLSLSGNGIVGDSLLNLNPASIAFGNIPVSDMDTRGATLTNSGGVTVIVSQANVTPGTDYSVTGIFLPLILAPGATTTFIVDFAPSVAGTQSGSVSIVSDASNSPGTISLSGAGVLDHSVDLAWDASISTVDGHNMYRSTQSGGPYARVNSSLVVPTTFTDSTVDSGVTYFYVVTAVDSDGVESIFSNEVSAVIPFP